MQYLAKIKLRIKHTELKNKNNHMFTFKTDNKTVNAVIIEDDEFSKFGIISAIKVEDGKQYPKVKIVGETKFGIRGLQITDEILPDIVICDIGLPDISGLEVIKRIKAKFKSRIKILVVSGNINREIVTAAISSGADSFFTKTTSIEKLVEAICTTAKGESWLDSNISKILINGFSHNQQFLNHDLTKRELTILELIAEGLQNEEIANKLCISDGTVRSHTHNIYAKLSVTSRTQAVIKGIRLGIIMVDTHKNHNCDLSQLKMKNFVNTQSFF
ncbi:MAG: response regulator transcription factor [Richelia sp. RM1_1_1]|nr:response regulator transcription factor [Richelia sp. RM1_1_1]